LIVIEIVAGAAGVELVGRRASAFSQRHRVVPLISATKPCATTSCWISAMESRENSGKVLRDGGIARGDAVEMSFAAAVGTLKTVNPPRNLIAPG
jgi:hypothetical protein